MTFGPGLGSEMPRSCALRAPMRRTPPSGPPTVGSWIPLIALVVGPNLAAGDTVGTYPAVHRAAEWEAGELPDRQPARRVALAEAFAAQLSGAGLTLSSRRTRAELTKARSCSEERLRVPLRYVQRLDRTLRHQACRRHGDCWIAKST